MLGVGSLGGLGAPAPAESAESPEIAATFDASMAEDLIRPVPFQEIPNFPECDYDKSPTFLFKAIEGKDWPAVKRFLLGGQSDSNKTPPSTQVCTWVTKYEASIDGKEEYGKWTQLPIHAALVYGAPDDVIRLLLKICPGAVQCADDQRMLPLHLAFRHGASDSTVGFLLDLFPEAVHARDFNRHTPVEAGLHGPHSQRGRVIQKIFQRHKASWKRQQAKMETTQRKQKEKLSQARQSLQSKTTEVANLSVSVDLIKWREDQTKKVLLTLMSELKDINGWYQQHEKRLTKEAIVEDLATRMTALQQIAEELVAQAERQSSDDFQSAKNPKRELFGNLPSLMTNQSKADADVDSLSAYSFGTSATAASFCEDKIQMNNHIVFLGSYDSTSNVSDSFTKQPLLVSKASFGRNRSTSSFGRKRSTSRTESTPECTAEAILEVADKGEQPKEHEDVKQTTPSSNVEDAPIMSPTELFQEISSQVSGGPEPSESHRRDSSTDILSRNDRKASSSSSSSSCDSHNCEAASQAPPGMDTLGNDIEASASTSPSQNNTKQPCSTEDSSQLLSSLVTSSTTPSPISLPPISPPKETTKKTKKAARKPFFLTTLKNVSRTAKKHSKELANIRFRLPKKADRPASKKARGDKKCSKVSNVGASASIELDRDIIGANQGPGPNKQGTDSSPESSSKEAPVAVVVAPEVDDKADLMKEKQVARTGSNVSSKASSHATLADENGAAVVSKFSSYSEDSSDVSSKTSNEEEGSHEEFAGIDSNKMAGSVSISSDVPGGDEKFTAPEEIDAMALAPPEDNNAKSEDTSDVCRTSGDEIDNVESVFEQTSDQGYDVEKEDEETLSRAFGSEVEDNEEECIEVTETPRGTASEDIATTVCTSEDIFAGCTSEDTDAGSTPEDAPAPCTLDEIPEVETEEDCLTKSSSSVKCQSAGMVEEDPKMILVSLPSQQTQDSQESASANPTVNSEEGTDSVSKAEEADDKATEEDEGMFIEIVDTYDMYPFDNDEQDEELPPVLSPTSDFAKATIEVMNDDVEVEVVLPYETVEPKPRELDDASNCGETQSIVSDLRSSFLGAVRKANKTASKIASKTKSAPFNTKNGNARVVGMNGAAVSPGLKNDGAAKPDLAARKKIFKSIVKQGAKVVPAATDQGS